MDAKGDTPSASLFSYGRVRAGSPGRKNIACPKQTFKLPLKKSRCV